jgi:hypothetical protein
MILEDDAVFSEKPQPQNGMTYLGGYESDAGIYGFHAIMYGSSADATSFLEYAKARKNTIDSIGNAFRKSHAWVQKYRTGFIVTQRLSYSDIEAEVVLRTANGKVVGPPTKR